MVETADAAAHALSGNTAGRLGKAEVFVLVVRGDPVASVVVDEFPVEKVPKLRLSPFLPRPFHGADSAGPGRPSRTPWR
jgi:hypothetical protein